MADTRLERPRPIPTDATKPYWEGTSRGVLRFQRCRTDGRAIFYPRVACPFCGGDDLEWFKGSGEGAIYSFTVVHKAANEAFRPMLPYVVAIVETDEGVRLVTNIKTEDPESVAIGDRVHAVFEEIADGVTIPLFALGRMNRA